MFRGVKAQNRLCHEREVERNKRIHRRRLRLLKANDGSGDYALTPSVERPTNRKREVLARQRQKEMDRENKILMAKMAAIETRRNAFRNPWESSNGGGGGGGGGGSGASGAGGGGGNSAGGGGAGGEDGGHSSQSVGGPPPAKSLNIRSRLRDYDRIAAENATILRRIEGQKPYYDSAHWAEIGKQQEERMRHCRKDTTSGFLKGLKGGRGSSASFAGAGAASSSRERPGGGSSAPNARPFAWLAPTDGPGGDGEGEVGGERQGASEGGGWMGGGERVDARARAEVMRRWNTRGFSDTEWSTHWSPTGDKDLDAGLFLGEGWNVPRLSKPRRPPNRKKKQRQGGHTHHARRRRQRSQPREGGGNHGRVGGVGGGPSKYAATDIRPDKQAPGTNASLLFKVGGAWCGDGAWCGAARRR